MLKPALLLTLAILTGAAAACAGAPRAASLPAQPGRSAAVFKPERLRTTQAACSPATGVPPANGAVVETGALQGVSEGATLAFKGIPYAAPPVTDLRWQNPQPAACWPGVRDASQFGSICPQMQNGQMVGDEDCLTLNVWTPSLTPANPASALPVMFFVHGGGNVQGSSADQAPDGTFIYDGAVVAAKGNAVVVTINYRLGPLGFLAATALAAEPNQSAPGNYGLMDQIAALGWVQRNVAAFGGDPARVLLFGESAGGLDTCVLVASPLARGLFSRALMESGGCVVPTLAEQERQGDALVQSAGCAAAADVPACLRALSPADLESAAPYSADLFARGAAYGPNLDGTLLTQQPIIALRAGTANSVPFVIGANADEMSRMAPPVPSAASYEAIVRQLYPRLADGLLQLYPAGAFATPRQALVRLSSDARFICPARAYAAAAAAGGSAPVYRYFFTHALDSTPFRLFGAWHGQELIWLFGHGDVAGYQPSAAEQAMSDAMIGYWSRFAATGDPNGGGAVTWPRYDPASDSYLALDDTIAAGAGVRTAQCDALESLLAGAP